MTRLTHLFTAVALSGVLAGAVIAACGGRPGAPGEVSPLAPRPERVDPTDPTAVPVPGANESGEITSDANRLPPPTGPLALGAPAVFVADPQQAGRDAGVGGVGDGGAGPGNVDAGAVAPSPTTPPPATIDASVIDSYTPPLPPIPDGGIPADSRMEPIRLRD